MDLKPNPYKTFCGTSGHVHEIENSLPSQHELGYSQGGVMTNRWGAYIMYFTLSMSIESKLITFGYISLVGSC